MAEPCINRLLSGGIIVNYLCSSSCGHCLYRSSPRRERGYMTPAALRPMLQKVASLGVSSMHIGGGEPLLDEDALVAVLDVCQECGIAIDYIETNSSWYRDHASAVQTIERLLAHGCDTLLISISPFHAEYIAFKKVRGVLEACRETGMRIFPWTTEYVPEISRLDENKPHKFAEFKAVFGDDFVKRIPSRYSLNLNGRALDTFRDLMPAVPVERILSETRRPCGEMWQNSHFHIDLHGNFVFTACVGMACRVDDLGHPLSCQKYPWTNLLHNEGLPALCRTAQRDHGFTPQKTYLNKCDLCQDIRRHLVIEKKIDSPDLQPIGYYKEMENAK